MSTYCKISSISRTEHGFVTDIESDVAPKGLSEDTIRLISAKKNEPQWLLEFRLEAYRHWLDDGRAAVAERQVSEDRFPGDQLLLGAEAEAEARPAWTRSIPSCCARSRSSACR